MTDDYDKAWYEDGTERPAGQNELSEEYKKAKAKEKDEYLAAYADEDKKED